MLNIEASYKNYVPNEISLLAKQQLEILMHRFPDYDYQILAFGKSDIRIAVTARGYTILFVSFSDRAILIRVAPVHLPNWNKIIDYVDPEFTDDMLSDMLLKLVGK